MYVKQHHLSVTLELLNAQFNSTRLGFNYLLLTYLVGVVAIHFSIDHYPAERGGWTEEHDTFEKWG